MIAAIAVTESSSSSSTTTSSSSSSSSSLSEQKYSSPENETSEASLSYSVHVLRKVSEPKGVSGRVDVPAAVTVHPALNPSPNPMTTTLYHAHLRWEGAMYDPILIHG